MAIIALLCALATSAPAHAAKLAFVTDREVCVMSAAAWQPAPGAARPQAPSGTPAAGSLPVAGAPVPSTGVLTAAAGAPKSTHGHGRRPVRGNGSTRTPAILRVTLDLRRGHVRVVPGRLEIAGQIRSNGPAVATIEVRHAGRLVVRIVRRLSRGTSAVRWQRRIGAEAPWRGRYRIALHVRRR